MCQLAAKDGALMKGSITFKFGGDTNDYRVHIFRKDELDTENVEVLVALINEDIMLKKAVESGEITSTLPDPTGLEQLQNTWSN